MRIDKQFVLDGLAALVLFLVLPYLSFWAIYLFTE